MPTAPSSSSKRGFFIEVGCPGCGGELEIDSDFFVTKCSHCGSPLRLILPDTVPAYLIPNKLTRQEARFKIDRHLKSSGLPLTGQSLVYKQIYYPYWKVDAMLLRLRNRRETVAIEVNEQTGEEITDFKNTSQVNLAPYQVSVAASTHLDGVPDSLGIRGQTLKVIPFSDTRTDGEFDFLEIRRAPQEVVKTVELSLQKMSAIHLADFGRNLTKIFNPRTSLLYFPFCVAEDYAGEGFRRYVLDGLTGRVLSKSDSENADVETPKKSGAGTSVFQLGDSLFDAIEDSESVLAGEDLFTDVGLRLEAGESSQSEELPQVKFGAVKITFHRCENCGVDLPARPSCLYICRNCHVITCLDSSINFKPKVYAASESDQHSQFFPFWIIPTTTGRLLGFPSDAAVIAIPAFKIPNFEALYRLCKRVSTASEKIDNAEIESLDNRFVPVDILPSEAITLANVIYYRYSMEKTGQLPKREMILEFEKLSLNYLPFRAENYFFVDSVLKSVTFEKKLVSA
jgi:hypothetical protein